MMWTWLLAIGGIVVFVGAFWLLHRTMKNVQAEQEGWKRGQDSSGSYDSR